MFLINLSIVPFLRSKIFSKDSISEGSPLNFLISTPTEKLLTSKARILLFLSNIFPLLAKSAYSE